MKVLVTGGGGFLGQAICAALQDRGKEPIAFQRSESPLLKSRGIKQHLGDIRDYRQIADAIALCDAVIHTAGKAGPWGDAEIYHAINVQGTEHVINACRLHGVSRLVFTSSPSVVHGGGDIEGGDESLPYPEHFGAAYPESKALAEQRVMVAQGDGLNTVSLRPHLVWGPGDNHLLPRLMTRAESGPLRLPGAEKLIDTVYIDNAAEAHLLALDALDSRPQCHGRTYFISNGDPWPQGKIMTALLEAVGVQATIRPMSKGVARTLGAVTEWIWRTSGKSGEPPITRWSAEQLSTAHWYDIGAARRDLGYEPQVSINEGLKRLAAAFRRGAAQGNSD